MKVFLSSTTEDLTDARLTFIEQFEEICDHKIELISYEKHGRHSTLGPEDTCLALVRKCQGLIVLFDQYYGTMCKKYKNISITHAEVKEALSSDLHIIPIVRTQSWHEFMVWRKNQGVQITFHHVKEPRLFEILEGLIGRFNCHHYDDFTTVKTQKEISKSIDGMLRNGDLGAMDHIALV
jgi:Domain of unknown function (DUF4062)